MTTQARIARGSALAAASIALGVLLAPATASAAPADAAGYGQHVAGCVQSMGFDGEHNPGMHRGISMWDPHHTC